MDRTANGIASYCHTVVDAPAVVSRPRPKPALSLNERKLVYEILGHCRYYYRDDSGDSKHYIRRWERCLDRVLGGDVDLDTDTPYWATDSDLRRWLSHSIYHGYARGIQTIPKVIIILGTDLDKVLELWLDYATIEEQEQHGLCGWDDQTTTAFSQIRSVPKNREVAATLQFLPQWWELPTMTQLEVCG